MAYRYDAIVFGDHLDVNRSISGALGERARHRPLEIASLIGSPSDFLQEREGKSRAVTFSSPCELNKIISSWSGTGATSVLVLPFLRDESFLDSIRPIDKATFVQAASNDSGFRSIELVDREVTGESGYTEITGYFIQDN
jgi:hypothetical protein